MVQKSHDIINVKLLHISFSCMNLLKFQCWKMSGDNDYHLVGPEEDQEENQVSCFTDINIVAYVFFFNFVRYSLLKVVGVWNTLTKYINKHVV